MKLFEFVVRKDWGTDWNIILFKTKRLALFQLCLSWCEYGSLFCQMSFGMGRLFSLLLSIGKFSICLDLIGYPWVENYSLDI